MNNSVVMLAAVIVLALVPVAVAETDQEVWICMFDGKTFGAWKPNERPEVWTIEDGTIVAHGPRSHLYYMDRQFKDFHFKADVLTTPESNSGIFFHTTFVAEGWPQEAGYECQVNNTHGDPVRTGSLYHTVGLFNAEAEDNKWFALDIIVRGKRIVVKIDGRKVIDYTEPEGKKGPVKLGKGYFALQAHDPKSLVRYKNLKVRALTPDERS